MRCSEPLRLICRYLLAIVSLQLWACSNERRIVDEDDPRESQSHYDSKGPQRNPRDSGTPDDELAIVESDNSATQPEIESRPEREGSAASKATKDEALQEQLNQRKTDDPAGTRTSSQPSTDSDSAPELDRGPDSSSNADPASASPRRPTVTSTKVLAPLAGHMATPAAGQANIGMFGTDLGFSFAHQGRLRFLFGDTWSDDRATLIDSHNDDVQGFISLADFPTGRSVDDYVRAHPAASGQPDWKASAPPITYTLNALGRVAPIGLQRDGTALSAGLGKTPTAGFSNGRDVFAVFHRWIPVECSGGANPSCDEGYTCDTGLGTVLGAQADLATPCLLSELGCGKVPGAGLCQDRTSSTYSDDPWGRKEAIVLQDEIGNLDRNDPTRFLTRKFETRKFRNPAVRTVASFDPNRAHGAGNDYKTAPAAGSADSKVFVWGRPAFGSPAARGGNDKLYFMYFDLPEYSATGDIQLSMHYFTGLRDGIPQFSSRATDAVALDLSFPGDDRSIETWDLVLQMSITWVESIGQWVMFYGGDLPARAVPIVVGQDARINPDPEGAIHVRYAAEPWGPWSAPEQLFKAVDLQDPNAGAAADGGILRRPTCKAETCAPHEPGYADDAEIGVLYAAAIIEPWTETFEAGVDLYWAVSTWDPYQVVLMKSRIELR